LVGAEQHPGHANKEDKAEPEGGERSLEVTLVISGDIEQIATDERRDGRDRRS
jgi:hypothetical protein